MDWHSTRGVKTLKLVYSGDILDCRRLAGMHLLSPDTNAKLQPAGFNDSVLLRTKLSRNNTTGMIAACRALRLMAMMVQQHVDGRPANSNALHAKLVRQALCACQHLWLVCTVIETP